MCFFFSFSDTHLCSNALPINWLHFRGSYCFKNGCETWADIVSGHLKEWAKSCESFMDVHQCPTRFYLHGCDWTFPSNSTKSSIKICNKMIFFWFIFSLMIVHFSSPTMEPIWIWSPLWMSKETSWRAFSRTTWGETHFFIFYHTIIFSLVHVEWGGSQTAGGGFLGSTSSWKLWSALEIRSDAPLFPQWQRLHSLFHLKDQTPRGVKSCWCNLLITCQKQWWSSCIK